MRSLITAITLFISGSCFAQQRFEGTIVYKLHSEQEKKDGKITIVFGSNAVKLKVEEMDAPDENADEVLIRFDSAKIYTIRTKEKNFWVKRLIENNPQEKEQVLQNKTIAGFSAKANGVSYDPLDNLLGTFFRNTSIILYVADSLFYPIPVKYSHNPEFSFVNKDRIVLGASFKGQPARMQYGGEDEMTAGKMEETLSAEAISVTRETINETAFLLPAGFEKRERNYYASSNEEMRIADSLAYMRDLDSAIKATPAKTPVKKQAVNKSQPSKPPTKGTGSQPARKPE